MQPNWHLALEIGVGVFTAGVGLMLDGWMLATAPRHRVFRALALWISIGMISAAPYAWFHGAGWLAGGAFFGVWLWGMIEQRRRFNRWLYRELPAARTREDEMRRYHPKSFDT